MLAGVRDAQMRRRMQLRNMIRRYAAEFGLTVAKGLDKIEPLLVRIECLCGGPGSAVHRATHVERPSRQLARCTAFGTRAVGLAPE